MDDFVQNCRWSQFQDNEWKPFFLKIAESLESILENFQNHEHEKIDLQFLLNSKIAQNQEQQ